MPDQPVLFGLIMVPPLRAVFGLVSPAPTRMGDRTGGLDGLHRFRAAKSQATRTTSATTATTMTHQSRMASTTVSSRSTRRGVSQMPKDACLQVLLDDRREKMTRHCGRRERPRVDYAHGGST